MSMPFTIGASGLRLAVRLTPRASRSAIMGLVEAPEGRSALSIRLAAPPVEGAANKALRRLIADQFGLPVSKVKIVSGENSRLKILDLSGEGDALAERIVELLGKGKT
jgi:hypothetical protein